MRTPLAHSARKNYPPQTYEAHVRGVCERAGKYAAEAECYSVKANGILSAIVRDSAAPRSGEAGGTEPERSV